MYKPAIFFKKGIKNNYFISLSAFNHLQRYNKTLTFIMMYCSLLSVTRKVAIKEKAHFLSIYCVYKVNVGQLTSTSLIM